MLQAVIYYIVTVILTKELVIATDQCTEYQFKSPFFPGVSCEDIYNKNPQSHDKPGYYWILDGPRRVYCGMTYTGSSCEDIYNNNQSYVSGLSITYNNNPRKHIWTFASGFSERYSVVWNCPCSIRPGNDPPSFVDNDYYCESGSVDWPSTSVYYFNDTLWDGAGCTSGTCCDDTTQPWFYRQLNQTTQDDIEA